MADYFDNSITERQVFAGSYTHAGNDPIASSKCSSSGFGLSLNKVMALLATAGVTVAGGAAIASGGGGYETSFAYTEASAQQIAFLLEIPKEELAKSYRLQADNSFRVVTMDNLTPTADETQTLYLIEGNLENLKSNLDYKLTLQADYGKGYVDVCQTTVRTSQAEMNFTYGGITL